MNSSWSVALSPSLQGHQPRAPKSARRHPAAFLTQSAGGCDEDFLCPLCPSSLPAVFPLRVTLFIPIVFFPFFSFFFFLPFFLLLNRYFWRV